MAIDATTRSVPAVHRLWKRDLNAYPTGIRRYGNLAIVVAVTIVLYYQLYVGGAVATQILAHFDMSFLYYATVLAIANAAGAVAALAAGISDRVGRANLAVFGTIAVSLVTIFAVPNAGTKLEFAAWLCLAGVMEGMVLVATPALVRDFSPQVGRAQAMAFWTMGPVLGSLVVSLVTSSTLDALPAWQDQFRIAGVVGIVVGLVSLLFLRELDATLRNQVVGALEAQTHDLLAERGLTPEEAVRRPFRQMLKLDIIGSSLAISLFLLLYYTAVSFLPVFFETSLGFTESQANSLLNWLWATTAISMLAFGILSDKLRVRKPFMLVGGLITVAVDIAFVAKAGDTAPSYSSVAILLMLSGFWSGAVYVPWMASFTETVERRNPALTATGLAVWGWILRLVVAASIIVLPHLVTSVTPLVDNGAKVQEAATRLSTNFPNLFVEAQVHPEVFQQLGQYADPATIPPEVLKKAVETVGSDALTQLQNPAAVADLTFLSGKDAADVLKAQKDSPDQWNTWLWICTAGAVAFLPFVFAMAGRWRPGPKPADETAPDVVDVPTSGRHDATATATLPTYSSAGSER